MKKSNRQRDARLQKLRAKRAVARKNKVYVPLETKMKTAVQNSIDAGNIPNNAVISL